MKDPVRLLDGAGSESERVLLRAAATEEPPADGAQRLAAVLGLPAGAVTGSQANASAGGSAGAGGQVGAGAAGQAGVTKLALKASLLAAFGVAVTTAVLVLPPDAARSPQPEARGAAQQPIAAPERERAHEPEPSVEAVVEAPAAEPPSAPEARRTPDRAPRAPERSKSIAREIAQLDAARDRLHRGEARAALALLEAYRSEHPSGVLQQEAALLRIEALVRTGERDAVRQLARRFLRDHPGSPHAQRIRALLDGSEGDAR